jgi:adenylate kinase
MDRVQKLEYEKSMEEYFHTHKVYELIERLFEELIVNKPENPIDYLIERLKRKTTKRIFITGTPGAGVDDICLALTNSLEYKCINMTQLIDNEISNESERVEKIKKNYNECRYIDDDIIIDILREQLIKCEEENISYIVEDFPRNRTQAIFLQSFGLLPDNVILLKTSKEKSLESIEEKIKNNFENDGIEKTEDEIKNLSAISYDESDINLKALKDIFNGYYQEVDVDKFEQQFDIVDTLANLLKYKIKSSEARNPPRIMLIIPPCFNKKRIGMKVSSKLKISNVDVMDLLKREIEKKNENSKNILDALDRNDTVDNKYVLKFLEERLYSSDCTINGWVTTGFPKSELQINYMDHMKSEIRPNLIVLIDPDEKRIEENADKKRYDPCTGISYIEGTEEYSKLGEEELNRLIKRKQDEGEVLKKRIENWKNIAGNIIKKDYNNLIKFTGNESEDEIVEGIINKLGFNQEK